MLLDLLIGLLVFSGLALGPAWPVAARLALAPAERLVVSLVLSLLGNFVFAWAVYVFALPLGTLWALPAFAVAGLALGLRTLAATLRDADARGLLTAQAIVTLSCVGWLALIVSYGGGAWIGDWYGHLQRTWFFLERWPTDTLFNGFDPVPSRPPFANILNGALLTLTTRNFAHYQLASTLLGSLAFLPAGLLARRFSSSGSPDRGRKAVAILAVLFLVNPLWVQNATYPWTKLLAACFVLAALYFFLRAHDSGAPVSAGPLFATSLACGILTHYSAGPYAVALALAWLAFGLPRRQDAAWWRATALAAGAGTLVLVLWFGWALAVYGGRHTFLSNTTVAGHAPTAVAQLHIIALNLRDTLVPHFLRTTDPDVFVQSSAWGWWRDWFFQLYQANLFFAFGSVAWLAILVAVVRRWRDTPASWCTFWAAFAAVTSVLGVAAVSTREPWGLAHICLQPLVLIGLAFLAAGWDSLGAWWRGALAAGATVDLVAGIILQAGAQSTALDRWLAPQRSAVDSLLTPSNFAQVNLRAKLDNHWVFLGDNFSPYAALVVLGLTGLLVLALFRASRAKNSLQNPAQS